MKTESEKTSLTSQDLQLNLVISAGEIAPQRLLIDRNLHIKAAKMMSRKACKPFAVSADGFKRQVEAIKTKLFHS